MINHRADAKTIAAEIRNVRQIRQFRPDPVPPDVLQELLEIARWTGSSRNSQPWHFIVIDDKAILQQISQLRPPINWVAGAPLALAIVLNGESPITEAFDEGRVTERLLIGAHIFGLGGGTAWFGNEDQEAAAKEILGIPPERAAHSVVALGYPLSAKDHRPTPVLGGRKSLAELVSYNRFGVTR